MSWYHGHLSIGRVTIYGANAMHFAVNIRTRRWGYICFRPTTWYRIRDGRKRWGKWSWYFYVSPNATPWASTFAIGPGISRDDKEGAKRRYAAYGHNFDTSLLVGKERNFR